MIWNGLTGDERLRLWKTFRKTLQDMPEIDALLEISKFFERVPYGARSIDYYSSENWPTPWEILYHGDFCTSSISLLVYHTIKLTYPEKNVSMMLIDDKESVYLIVSVDNTMFLNYIPGVISNYQDIKDDFSVLKVYTAENIKTLT